MLTEPLVLTLVDFEDVFHIIDSIIELTGGERAVSPVGPRLASIRLASENSLDDGLVPEREAARAKPLGDLYVPQMAWRRINICQTEPHLLAPTVDDDHRLIVGHQLPPSTQVQDLVGVNGHTALSGRELQQTQLGTVREFRDELGIKRDQTGRANMLTKVIEFGLVGDQEGCHAANRFERGFPVEAGNHPRMTPQYLARQSAATTLGGSLI